MSEESGNIHWDESGQPISRRFGDVYFSRENGLEESFYVFIQQNNLEQKFSCLSKCNFTIAETGFGTGLNFLLAWQTWNRHQKKHGKTLHFISVEKYPLSCGELKKAYQLWPQLSEYASCLIQAYPPENSCGTHRMHFEKGKVKLTLLFAEASESLQKLADYTTVKEPDKPPWQVDCWFLDGFAPAKNPEMWSNELFHTMARLSSHTCSFSTFTAAGFVRRGLQEVGFSCEKSSGFGKKREMLRGEFTQQSEVKNTSWLTCVSFASTPESIAIIGGGIAGCTLARALAERGLKVELFEKNTTLASEGSGNVQGVVYTRLSPHNDALSRFNLAAQIFANHYYEKNGMFDREGQACGVLHLACDAKQENYYQQISDLHADSGFARWLDQEQASLVCGVNTKNGGLFIEKSGWLKPASLCASLCQHHNISIRLGKFIEKIKQNELGWQLISETGETLDRTKAVVVACAHSATHFPQLKHLCLKSIRGQVSYLKPAQQLPLKTVLCGDGYITPPCDNIQSLGATFNLNNQDTQLSFADHQSNLSNIQDMLQNHYQFDIDEVQGRVGFRCTSLDYFPLCGPVAEPLPFIERFSPWRKNASTPIEKPGIYHANLYCHLAFGSRALAYAPLCSEQLASIICEEPLPLDHSLHQHIHPARFLVRDLKRNKI